MSEPCCKNCRYWDGEGSEGKGFCNGMVVQSWTGDVLDKTARGLSGTISLCPPGTFVCGYFERGVSVPFQAAEDGLRFLFGGNRFCSPQKGGFPELAGWLNEMWESKEEMVGGEPSYPYPAGAGIDCLAKSVVFSVEYVNKSCPPVHSAGHQVYMWIKTYKFPIGDLWCDEKLAWDWLEGLFDATDC